MFDGQGHIISNLTISNVSKYVGLFGRSSGEIGNVRLENVNINLGQIDSSTYIGALCGYSTGQIENVVTTGNIELAAHSSSYESYVGGVVGYSSTDIRNACNKGNITGYRYVGGISGMVELGVFDGLMNSGTIESKYVAGGLIGYCRESAIFNKCFNEGTILASSFAGGLLATTFVSVNSADMDTRLTILDSGNTGEVDSSSSGNMIGCGGLIGTCINASVQDCFNKGDIKGSFSGGIIGVAYQNFTANRVYSSGDITGEQYAAGILAYALNTTISDSAVFGIINGQISNSISGIAIVFAPNLSNVYYNCTADECLGIKTNYKFEKEFYTDSLFWNEEKWIFFEDDYPILKYMIQTE